VVIALLLSSYIIAHNKQKGKGKITNFPNFATFGTILQMLGGPFSVWEVMVVSGVGWGGALGERKGR
jgi:hypothetical protein